VYVPFICAASCGVVLQVLRNAPPKFPRAIPYIFDDSENDSVALNVCGSDFE
jgi:hypothetical protein